jgi:acyl-coenzyme A synthetase/AMP-(fatty) acid ligase
VFWQSGREVADAELKELQAEVARRIGEQQCVAVHSADPVLVGATLLLCRELERTLLLVHATFAPELAAEVAAANGAAVLVTGDSAAPQAQPLDAAASEAGEPSLGIFTSGTSGQPKLVLHDWARVQDASRKVPATRQGRRWLMTYLPTAFAGVQVFFAAVNSGGQLHFTEGGFAEVARVIANRPIEVISGTPTWWRMLINAWPADLTPPTLLQATLGGEIVRQDVLDSIRRTFDPGKITHIYASTEAGSAITVSDGLEGFPIAWLERSGPVRVRISDGLLEIHSEFAMKRYADGTSGGDDAAAGWIRTPDLVEIRDDRVIFIGRQDGMINVGGSKISPEAIELVINELDGVTDSFVYQKKSPITGELLAADLVLSGDRPWTVAEVKAELRARLAATHVPQLVKFVDSLRLAPNGKKLRTR